MIDNSEDLKFENLDYGAYVMQDHSLYSENVKYGTAEFMRLNIRRIRLPDGKGNVIYLLSNTFQNSINMINSNYFIIPPTYQRFFYPWIHFGMFMGRRFQFNLTKVRAQRLAAIKDQTNLRPYATRFLTKSTQNVFFSTSDLYEVFQPIVDRFPIKKIYDEFFQEFYKVLDALTPPPTKPSTDKEWNNRLLIIDADRKSVV